MSIKGKIYAKYLKKAKYVVRGRRLHTPIATIQKRVVPIQVLSDVSAPMQKKVQEQGGLQLKKVNSNDFNTPSSKRNKKSNEEEISFVELGKKIVDGDEDAKDKKGDSKTMMFVCAALAVIIIAAMVKVGSMVYTEISPNKNVANKESKEMEDNDDLKDFLLGNNDTAAGEMQPTEEEMEEILTDVLEAEGTDINSISEAEKAAKIKEIEQVVNNSNNSTSNTTVSRQDYLDQIKDKMTNGENSSGSGNNTPNNSGNNGNNNSDKDEDDDDDNDDNDDVLPSNPGTGNPGNNPTAGDDDNVTYVTLGHTDKAYNLYHIAKSSVIASNVTSYGYNKGKTENGAIKVPASESYGLWFIDDGSGAKVLTGYNSIKVDVCTVTLKEKVNGAHEEVKYYVLKGTTLSLSSNYLEENEGGEGKKEFTVNSDMVLYKK